MRIKDLRAENVRIHTELVALNDAAEAEGRDLGAEDQAKWDTLSAEFDKNKAARERLEQLEKVSAVQSEPSRQAAAVNQVEAPEGPSATSQDEYTEAFSTFVRYGKSEMTGEQRAILRSGYQRDESRALGDNPQTITTTAGGHAVPDAAMAALQENLLTYGGLRQAPITVHRTAGGNPWPIPGVDDTGNSGAILAINTATVDAKAAFSQLVLGAFKFTSQIILVPVEFLEDVQFDAVSWITGAIGTRIARGLAPYLINGDGAAEPGGLDMAATFVTAAGAAAITRDDIIDLIHAIDPAYRSGPAFGLVMKDSTVAALKKLAFNSSDARPLWVPSMRDGAPDTIEGVPYYVATDTSAIGAGLRSMYAGDLSKFWLREAGPVRLARMDERFGESDQVAFVGFARYDSNIVDVGTDPIKYLRHPAS